jgi:hypothetical protein
MAFDFATILQHNNTAHYKTYFSTEIRKNSCTTVVQYYCNKYKNSIEDRSLLVKIDSLEQK